MEDSWEARMAAKSWRREQARQAVAAAAEAVRREAEEAEAAEAHRAEFEAGPPGGCQICYFWTGSAWPCAYTWWHYSIETGDQMCRHECHAEPLCCAPIAFGAAG